MVNGSSKTKRMLYTYQGIRNGRSVHLGSAEKRADKCTEFDSLSTVGGYNGNTAHINTFNLGNGHSDKILVSDFVDYNLTEPLFGMKYHWNYRTPDSKSKLTIQQTLESSPVSDRESCGLDKM